MTVDGKGQGELFGGKRSRVADPGGRGNPTNAPTPGRRPRRGAEFVADPATAAHAETRRKLADRLEWIALQIGYGFGPKGFALWHVREAAIVEGALTGTESDGDPRALSWLGALLPGLARRGLIEKLVIDGRPQYDTSESAQAHGNKNVLWKLTADGRGYVESRHPR